MNKIHKYRRKPQCVCPFCGEMCSYPTKYASYFNCQHFDSFNINFQKILGSVNQRYVFVFDRNKKPNYTILKENGKPDTIRVINYFSITSLRKTGFNKKLVKKLIDIRVNNLRKSLEDAISEAEKGTL